MHGAGAAIAVANKSPKNIARGYHLAHRKHPPETPFAIGFSRLPRVVADCRFEANERQSAGQPVIEERSDLRWIPWGQKSAISLLPITCSREHFALQHR